MNCREFSCPKGTSRTLSRRWQVNMNCQLIGKPCFLKVAVFHCNLPVLILEEDYWDLILDLLGLLETSHYWISRLIYHVYLVQSLGFTRWGVLWIAPHAASLSALCTFLHHTIWIWMLTFLDNETTATLWGISNKTKVFNLTKVIDFNLISLFFKWIIWKVRCCKLISQILSKFNNQLKIAKFHSI